MELQSQDAHNRLAEGGNNNLRDGTELKEDSMSEPSSSNKRTSPISYIEKKQKKLFDGVDRRLTCLEQSLAEI